MKEIIFKGTSLDDIRDFPFEAKREVGYQLDRIQNGLEPSDWKPMPSVGAGVREIRVRDQSGAFRVIYVAKFEEAIYVLTAFQKKQQKTPQREIDIAKKHLSEIQNDR